MKNAILDNDPELALVNEIQRLEREFYALKHNQAPSVLVTDFLAFSFTLDPIVDTLKTDRHTFRAILRPPQDQVLFAVPEFSLYVDGFTSAGHFPAGSGWDSKINFLNIIEMSWRFSAFESDDKNLIAIIDIARQDYSGNYNSGMFSSPYPPQDLNPFGITNQPIILFFFLRWRFIVPEARAE